MSIIRSNIARQLLAEGGAPRKGFARGSTGFEGSPEMGGSRSDSMSDFTSDSYGEDFQGSAFGSNKGDMGSPPGGDADNIDFSNVTARDLFKVSASNPLLYRSGGERAALAAFPLVGPLITAGEQFAYDLPMFQYSRTGPDFKDRFNREEDDDSDPIILPKLRAPIEEKEPELTDFQKLLARAGARFEDGGDVRQEYGLGSIVKKATRAVKKVVKSPIGKAALLGGLAYFGPSFLAGTKFGFAGTQGPLALQRSMKAARLGRAFGEFAGGLNPLTTILGTSAIAGLASKEDEEEEKLPETVRSDPEMRAVLDYYGQRFAQGGEVEDEMLDLGGKEMDLRGGGFVPLGEYEKKDDVPARLSKNEFVFTADAVRAAGGGSVDKGADVMYKTMKTLENKVA
jgi:hypothetical protein